MAVNETIVTGRKFRKLTDAASKTWQRISFWHKASDCEFNDGKTAEQKLGAIKGITTDLNVTVPGYAADATRVSELNNSLITLETFFRNGCDTIIEAVTAKGQTPASNAPADIAKSIIDINTTKTITAKAHAHSKGGLTYIYVYLTCNGTTKMLANNHDEGNNQETNLGSVVF